MSYIKHNNEQFIKIIQAARYIFINQNYEKLSITAIAQQAKVTRATIYKFFTDKDHVLWEIQKYQFAHLGAIIYEELDKIEDNGINRFKAYLSATEKIIDKTPEFFLFFEKFDKMYQQETTSKEDFLYRKIFKSNDYGSKDTVKFLTERFYDGTIDKTLHSTETAVSIAYSAVYISIGYVNDMESHPIKYGVKISSLIKFHNSCILKGLVSNRGD